MTPFGFIVAAFASYRLSYAVAREEGPFGMFSGVRGRIDPDQKTWIGRGINCTVCVSFWLALPAAWLVGGGWLDWLAVAGAILAIHGLVMKNG